MAAKTEQGMAAKADQAQERAGALADRFQKELLGALTAAMESEGPVGAIAVCETKAPALATQLSQESGVSIRRTALRTRNPAAKADPTEERVMTDWVQAPLDEGGKPKHWSETRDGQYHYMRAIPTMPMCLTCHGDAIAPDVSAAIKAHYPDDQATGFTKGQLRGAFSIRWDIAK